MQLTAVNCGWGLARFYFVGIKAEAVNPARKRICALMPLLVLLLLLQLLLALVPESANAGAPDAVAITIATATDSAAADDAHDDDTASDDDGGESDEGDTAAGTKRERWQ